MCKFSRESCYICREIAHFVTEKRGFRLNMSRFKVTISSQFEELWRYNIVAICELCAADGGRIEYKSAESIVAPVGSQLKVAPLDYSVDRTIRLESGEGAYLNILIYVVPNTLPQTDDISKTKPFHLIVKVESESEVVVNRVFDINQWSGENISLKAEN